MGAGFTSGQVACKALATPLEVLRKQLVNPLSPVCTYISEQWMYLALVGLIGLTRSLPGLEMTCTTLEQEFQLPQTFVKSYEHPRSVTATLKVVSKQM